MTRGVPCRVGEQRERETEREKMDDDACLEGWPGDRGRTGDRAVEPMVFFFPRSPNRKQKVQCRGTGNVELVCRWSPAYYS